MKKDAASLRIDCVANGVVVRLDDNLSHAYAGLAVQPMQTFVFTDSAALGLFVREHFRDPASVPAPEPAAPKEQKPEPAKDPKDPDDLGADMLSCVPGQKLRLRDGSIASYVECTNTAAPMDDCPHRVRSGRHGTFTTTHKGRWAVENDERDVVEILPVEPGEKTVDLRGCVAGQKLRLRDGSVATYLRCTNTAAPMDDCPHWAETKDRGRFTLDHAGRWAWEDHPFDVVEILPVERS
jgi:hypothetical protein